MLGWLQDLVLAVLSRLVLWALEAALLAAACSQARGRVAVRAALRGTGALTGLLALAICTAAAVNVGVLGCGTAALVGGDSLPFDAVAEMWGLTAALLLANVLDSARREAAGSPPGPLAPHADALTTLLAVLTLVLPAVGAWSLAAAMSVSMVGTHR